MSTRWIHLTAAAGVLTIAACGCGRNQVSRDSRNTEDSMLAGGQHARPAPDARAMPSEDVAHGDLSAPGNRSIDHMHQQAQMVLAGVVQAAATENRLPDLLQRLSKVNHGPIALGDAADGQALNAAIVKFQADWKQMYGQAFYVVGQRQVVFGGPVLIQPGQDTEGARLATERVPGEPATAAAGVMSPNDLVRVEMPEFWGAPDVTLQLRRDADGNAAAAGYKVLVPDNLDAAQLRERLTRCFQTMTRDAERWPSDPAEAGRIVAQRTLAAITGGGVASAKLEKPTDATD